VMTFLLWYVNLAGAKDEGTLVCRELSTVVASGSGFCP
jgi:hypothetical protein